MAADGKAAWWRSVAVEEEDDGFLANLVVSSSNYARAWRSIVQEELADGEATSGGAQW
jgi:hypothetical protein